MKNLENITMETERFKKLKEKYVALEPNAAIELVDVFFNAPKLKYSDTGFVKKYTVGELFTLDGNGNLDDIDLNNSATFPKGPNLIVKYFDCTCGSFHCAGRTFFHSDFDFIFDIESERWSKGDDKIAEVINFSIVKEPYAITFAYPAHMKSDRVQKTYKELVGKDIFVHKYEIIMRSDFTRYIDLEKRFHEGYCAYSKKVKERLKLKRKNVK